MMLRARTAGMREERTLSDEILHSRAAGRRHQPLGAAVASTSTVGAVPTEASKLIPIKHGGRHARRAEQYRCPAGDCDRPAAATRRPPWRGANSVLGTIWYGIG